MATSFEAALMGARTSQPGSMLASFTGGSATSGSMTAASVPTRSVEPSSRSFARNTGNLRAVQLLLGQAKIETTVRYLGVEGDDALRPAEQIELERRGTGPRVGSAPEAVTDAGSAPRVTKLVTD
jgi:hypothetical protein